MKTLKIQSGKKFQKRLLIHLLFWMISFEVLLRIFVGRNEIESIDLIYTFLFQLTLFPFVYAAILWLKPKFLSRGKWAYYLPLLAATIILGAGFNLLFFNKWTDLLFPDYYFISYFSLSEIGYFVFGHVFILTLLQLSIEWFELNTEKKKLAEIEKEKSQYEIKSLLSQINPHFLFNTLNGLYSMILNEKKQAADYVLKLSDVLRYVIYQSRKDIISLSEEIELLNNYIFLQKLRTDYPNVHFEIRGEIKEKKIPPMLFLPLVENAFKHSPKDNAEDSRVRIILRAEMEDIEFEIQNTKMKSENEIKEKTGGIGINNVKRRLEIFFPEKHELKITEEEDQFMIKLKIWNPSNV